MQRLPVDISTFSKIKELNCLYVDKTKYMYQMITEGTRYFLSRPRRFGRSLLVSTLNEILRGNKTLFDGLWIGSSDYEWREHAVINLDFSKIEFDTITMLEDAIKFYLNKIVHSYNLDSVDNNLSVALALEKLVD